MRKMYALLLAMCLLCGFAPRALAAETARAEFRVEELGQDGRFELKLTVYEAQFNVLQFALRFDPAVVCPVDAKTGEKTDRFNAFAADGSDADWMATIGTGLDAKEGLFKFAGYVTPGADSALVNDEGDVAAGEKGVHVFTFSFRKVSDGALNFWLATEKEGEPYDHSLPTGALLVNGGKELATNVSFRYPTGAGESADTPLPGDGGQEDAGMTRAERIKGTVIFQVGNSAAVVEGKLTNIYPGEPAVTAYAHDNRTFVPVRFVAENLKATVGWDNETRTVSIEKDGHKILMQVGATTYTLDGQEKTMDVPAEFKGDPASNNQRTMVPIRFVAEALDMDVKWESGSNAIIVSPKGNPWDVNGAMEKQLLSDTMLLLSPLVQGMAGQK